MHIAIWLFAGKRGQQRDIVARFCEMCPLVVYPYSGIIRFMASPQILAENAADRLQNIEDIKEEGYPISFGVQSSGANSYDPPGAYVEVGQAHVVPMDWIADFSNDVLKDDLFYVVTDEVDLRKCTHCKTPDGDLYILCRPEAFKTDGVSNQIYIIQTRGMYIGARDT